MLRFKRMIALVLCGCILPAIVWAQGQKQTPKPASAATPAVAMQVSVYQNGASLVGVTPAQIAASAESDFTAFNSAATYAMGLKKSVWLRLRVGSAQGLPANAWLVSFSKAFVDTAVLHTAGADGTWTGQAAGDWLAHRAWSIRSLTPQFWVPANSLGSQDMFLEVRNRTPLHFKVRLLSAQQASVEAQNNFFLIGLALGLMLLMVTASAVLVVTYRQAVYAWYGLYVAVNIFLSMSYTGLAAYALWPEASTWPEISIALLYMLSTVLQLQFCKAMFLSGAEPVWIQRAVLCALALGLLAIPLHFYTIGILGSALVFSVQIYLVTAISFSLMVRLFKRDSLVSWLCLCAFVPVMMIGGLSVLEHAGWVNFSWLPYNAPIYAFAFELPLLFAALYLYAQAQHAQTVRKSTLASTDLSSGFVHSSMHMDTLVKMWTDAKAAGQDLVVAYIEVSHQLNPVVARGAPKHERTAQRVVRLLRTVARECDTVTHVGLNLFAIMMPRTSLGDDVTDRLARLVALAAMTDQDATADTPIRFHIAVGSVRSFDKSAKKLHASLQYKLAQTDWGLRAIRYVRKRSAGKGSTGSSKPAETLSEFWERAHKEENPSRTASTPTVP